MATQDCILGMEFSGRNSEGQKVMGLLPAKVNIACKRNYLKYMYTCIVEKGNWMFNSLQL